MCTTVPVSLTAIRLPIPTTICPDTLRLTLGKTISDNLSLSVTGLNVANRRFLLDNSFTFGGTHYFNPRQICVQLRYRFHY